MNTKDQLEDPATINLAETKEVYRVWLRDKTKKQKTERFLQQLLHTTEVHLDELADDGIEALINYWLHYYEYWGSHEITYPFYSDDSYYMDSFIKLLVYKERVTSVAEDPSDANTLALICVSRAKLCECRALYPPKENLVNLLEQWSGKTIDANLASTFNGCVEYIFGPGCVPLFRSDVTKDAEFARYLHKLNLPLLGILPQNFGTTDTKTTLPNDISDEYESR